MVLDILRERDQGGFGERSDYGARLGGGIDVSVPPRSRLALQNPVLHPIISTFHAKKPRFPNQTTPCFTPGISFFTPDFCMNVHTETPTQAPCFSLQKNPMF